MSNRVFTALAVGLAGALACGAADAATFVFKGPAGGPPFATPTGTGACTIAASAGDLCSANSAAGLSYSGGGIAFSVKGLSGATPVQVIQDVSPVNSGLGVFTPGEGNSDDQVQLNNLAGALVSEALVFDFAATGPVALTALEFNAGDDDDCLSAPTPEGPCGMVRLTIDNLTILTFAAAELVTGPFVGTLFKFESITAGGGFVIAQLTATASPVPIPGAAVLLLSGIAGLGFASRRKKERA